MGKSVDSQIHELLIVGGTSRLKGIAQYLEIEVGIPARVADPFLNLPVSSKNFSEQHMQDISAMFPISIGLGVRDLIAAPASTATSASLTLVMPQIFTRTLMPAQTLDHAGPTHQAFRSCRPPQAEPCSSFWGARVSRAHGSASHRPVHWSEGLPD